MSRYEYRTLNALTRGLEEKLNELGAEGWMVVAGEGKVGTLVLMREIAPVNMEIKAPLRSARDMRLDH